MENYTLNTESKDIVGGINEVDYVNQFTFINGESDFWGKQEEGTVTGTLTQGQYNAIKTRIEKGLPVIIRVDYDEGYTSTFTAVSTSTSTIPGRYSFCYIDYNMLNNQYYIKWFRMDSDLTCQVYTKII